MFSIVGSSFRMSYGTDLFADDRNGALALFALCPQAKR